MSAEKQLRDELLEQRQRNIGPSLSVSYSSSPSGALHITRGRGQYLFAADGTRYLDCVNNVCHVGHCHPHVVTAAQAQLAELNTNTRYVYASLTDYARRLVATLPAPLEVCFFVCSGSEATDLALRMARTATGCRDVVCVDGAYHGNNTAAIEVSPYKFNGKGGQGRVPHVQVAEAPDTFRGRFNVRSLGEQADFGRLYADDVQRAVRDVQAEGRGVAAFICESVLGCAGQLPLPQGYLKHAYEHVRAAGGVCIADEVQVGFGRVGSHFWGFQLQGDDCVPDIVTMGKPIGNGFPLAAVVTTRKIADAFNNGMEYFNTFGGSPVSCAVGIAVLEVIEQERLQANALKVGDFLLREFERLKEQHALIGDVRGRGLFLGIELVRDLDTLEPAAEEASWIANQMKERGILISTDGPLHNVLKMKPPICFSLANARELVDHLDHVFAALHKSSL